ncbi:4-(cytidine 5'-diphospho)-2-C-methyl-D-erythritol kinase [soil metagenome]
MSLTALAPAKVNLFLHVGPTGSDGYHSLASWMVFADVGDTVSVGASEELAFEIGGPYADGVPANADNLVLRARDAVIQAAGKDAELPPFRLLLTKALPIASGIGGGSSDAAATLRLLGEVFKVPITPLMALSLGSDVPACLRAAPLIAEGRGEVLNPAPAMPTLDAVLVNPGVPSPTGAVYDAFDRSGVAGAADCPDLPPVIGSAEEVAALLTVCRNDLEAPAVALQPLIGEVLTMLREEPETLFARMSGSGATCFALCAGAMESESLAERIKLMRPDWWVRACRLGGPWE